MLNFHYSSLIKAPVGVVWGFHERPDILEILIPPWQPVEVVRREGGLEVGAVTELRIWLGPIPLTWIARHIQCQPESLFVDQQVEGPLKSWVHRHQFEAVGDYTRLTDAIAYELPGGEWSETILSPWGAARLQDMFSYRHQTTKQKCE